jgi:hypothetical protein
MARFRWAETAKKTWTTYRKGRRTRGLGRRRLLFPGATMNSDWRRAMASGPILLRVLRCKSARKTVGSYGGQRRSEVKRILMSGPSVPDTIVGGGRAVAELRREISLSRRHRMGRGEREKGRWARGTYRSGIDGHHSREITGALLRRRFQKQREKEGNCRRLGVTLTGGSHLSGRKRKKKGKGRGMRGKTG